VIINVLVDLINPEIQLNPGNLDLQVLTYYILIQGRRKVSKSVRTSSNIVGIIYPLSPIGIGLTDLLKKNWV
jgi:hypothetical protein